VKPAPFVYLVPETVEEALEALRAHGAEGKVLAGGQSLVPMMNMRLARPAVLVDVNRIGALSGIRRGDRVSIGATTRQADVLADADIAFDFPLVHEALRNVGHTANRARGTLGGSVAHADPAAEMPAVMLALGAEMVVRGPAGWRVVEADEFFVSYYTTDLDVEDLLVEIRLPARAPSAWGFREVARRHGDFAVAGAVVTATTDAAGLVESARIVLFGVADRPIRAERAEAALLGRRLDDEAVADEVAALAPSGIEFTSDVHVPGIYREEASVALVRRAVRDAAERAE
jgi:carbon-monoxide dehydrogenase medium subunit